MSAARFAHVDPTAPQDGGEEDFELLLGGGNAGSPAGENERDEEMVDAEETTWAFRGEMANSQLISTGLRGLFNGKRDQRVEVTVGEGLHMCVTDCSKAIQGIASVSANLFNMFETRDPDVDVCFRINLAIFLDCLSMCSGTTRLRLLYDSMEESLALQLNDGGVLTECNIHTIADGEDDSFDFAAAFRHCEHFNRGIVSSEILRDAFMEVSDIPGVSTVRLFMSPEAPFFRLSSFGQSGSCSVDFADKTFQHYEAQTQLEFEYRLNLMSLAFKPLADAEKTNIRVNSEGMLSFQHLIRIDGQKIYVEFFLLALCENGEGEIQEDS